MSERWLSLGTQWLDRRPVAGDILAVEYAAWQVTHIAEAEPTDEEREHIAVYRLEYRDRLMPYRLTLRRMYGPAHERENSAGDVAVRVPVRASRMWHHYPSGRVPLCSCCGHPFPCRMETAERESQRQGELLARRLDRIMPGICYGCGERITARQRSIRYPEPNVEVPGAGPPTFHARKQCRGHALDYERSRDAEPLATYTGWAEQAQLPQT